MLKKINNAFLKASVSIAALTSPLLRAAKGEDPFAKIEKVTEEGTESLWNVLTPLFAFILLVLVVLRYMEFIDNRKIFFAIGLMVVAVISESLVGWVLGAR